MTSFPRLLRLALPCLFALGWTPSASAQTWVPPRTTPPLVDLISVDRTGEPNWLYGAEDVAGDGPAAWTAAERAIDVRTVYLATTDDDLWLRAYVSSAAAPSSDLRLYSFLDTDRDEETGGSVIAPELDERLATDPTAGGYDWVVGVRGDGTSLGAWRWSAANDEYEPLSDVEVIAEAGVALDPIRINGDDHGYLQLRVALAELGMNSACDAELLVRSVADGGADLDVGRRIRCGSGDGGQVPRAAIPTRACADDEECVGGGPCLDGRCFIPRGCRRDDDCADDERCDDLGECVFAASSLTCDDALDCGDLACDAESACVACQDDADCGGARRCARTGRCVDVDDATPAGSGAGAAAGGTGDDPTALAEREKIQGGALTCAVSVNPDATSLSWVMWVVPSALGALRRLRRRKDPS